MLAKERLEGSSYILRIECNVGSVVNLGYEQWVGSFANALQCKI